MRWATSASPTTRRTPTRSRRSQIDSGDGCVEPSAETAQDGTYTPLARPLFIYVSNASYAEKPQVAGYVDYYVENLEEIVTEAQFIPLNEDQYGETQSALDALAG